MKKLTSVYLLSFFFIASNQASADMHGSMNIDKAYIAGFLSGAQVTDREIIRRFDTANQKEQKSDFFKRAFKTRVGERNTVPATFYAGFCLPDDVVNDTVVDNIFAEIVKSGSHSNLDNAKLVYNATQSLYPCKP